MRETIDALSAMQELERRGELPGQYKPLLDELRARGIAPPAAGSLVDGPMNAAMIGAGRTVDRLGAGVRDIGAMITGDDAARETIAAEQAEASQLMRPVEGEYPIASAVGGALPYFAVPIGAAAGAAGKAVQGVGSVASRLAPGIAGGLTHTGKAIGASMLADAALTGAGIGALEYGSSALGGAVGGTLGYGVGRGIAQGISPAASKLEPARKAVADAARRLGFKITPGQTTGSQFLQRLEASAESFAPTSAPFARAGARNQQLANGIALKSVGETGSDITGEVLGRAAERIGKRFDAIARNAVIQVDDPLIDALAAIEKAAPPIWGKSGNQTKRLIDDFLEEASKGPISGERYQQLVSGLGKEGRSLMRGEKSNPELAFAMFDAKEALDDALERSVGPKVRSELTEARTQWRMLTFLEAPGVVNTSKGDVSLRSLANVLKRKDKSGFARGRNQDPLYTAARFGQTFPPIVGDSGTATRLSIPMMMQGGMGAGAGVGAVTGGLLGDMGSGAVTGVGAGAALPLMMRGAAELYNTNPVQRYLTNTLIGDPIKRQSGGLLGRIGASSGLLAPME